MVDKNTSFERRENYNLIKTLIICFSIIIIIAILANVTVNRYTIVAAGDGSAYKINRITGKTYFIALTEEFEVKPNK